MDFIIGERKKEKEKRMTFSFDLDFLYQKIDERMEMHIQRWREEKKETVHPWGEFLDARVKAIHYFVHEKGYTNKQIVEALSMDEEHLEEIRKACHI